ncbi:MAG: hypothetical protein SGILL_010810 [Bacillariaceae sp.]
MKRVFDATPKKKLFPAVDLTPGVGVWTSELALRYSKPTCPAGLGFYPMSPEPSPRTQSQVKRGLEFLKEEATTRKPLFYDAKSAEPVYCNDVVELKDMTDESYNGKQYKVRDKKDEDTAMVQFFKNPNRGSNDEKEVKDPFPVSIGRNVQAFEPYTVERNILRKKTNEQRDAFFQSLMDRICQVDLLNPQTFKKLEKLTGQCALVTFYHPDETYRGRRRPNGLPVSWVEAMKVASQLLRPHGCLLTLDKFSLSSETAYGHCMRMEPIAHQMGMILDCQGDNGGNGVVFMIWRKVPPNFDRMAEMRSMGGGMDMMQALRWSPKMPEIDNHAAKQEEEKAAEGTA